VGARGPGIALWREAGRVGGLSCSDPVPVPATLRDRQWPPSAVRVWPRYHLGTTLPGAVAEKCSAVGRNLAGGSAIRQEPSHYPRHRRIPPSCRASGCWAAEAGIPDTSGRAALGSAGGAGQVPRALWSAVHLVPGAGFTVSKVSIVSSVKIVWSGGAAYLVWSLRPLVYSIYSAHNSGQWPDVGTRCPAAVTVALTCWSQCCSACCTVRRPALQLPVHRWSLGGRTGSVLLRSF
jgi:hypothetical protein